MPDILSSIDAWIVRGPNSDPAPEGDGRGFSGTLTITSAGFVDVPVVEGTLRRVGGRILGSLRIGESSAWIPVNVLHTGATTVNGGTFTFILPESEFSNFGVDGFFFAGHVVGTVNAAFTAVTLTLGPPAPAPAQSFAYIPAQQAASASIVLDEVVAPYVPVSYDTAGDSATFVENEDAQLEEVQVNKELSPFFHWGSLMGVERLPNESNPSFAGRISEAFVRKGSSSPSGLLNAITRDLGLSRRDVMLVGHSGAFAGDPSQSLVKVDDAWLMLYDRWSADDDFHLDLEIDLRDVRNLHLDELIGRINAESAWFHAIPLTDDPSAIWSRTLIQQANWVQVRGERVPKSNRFTLENGGIRPGSIFLSDLDTFASLVGDEADLNVAGDWFLDHATGFVHSISEPSATATASYVHVGMPFRLHASEAVVCDVDSPGFRRMMYEQVDLLLYDDPNATTVDSVPTTEMWKVIRELLEAERVHWGS